MKESKVSSGVNKAPAYSDMEVAPPFLRSAFNYDTDDVSRETGLLCEDESLTVQSQMEEADINTIVRRFGLTGELPSNVRMPLAEDFVDVFDFQSAMNAIRAAEESFAAMPADVRLRFNNSPEAFVEFCTAEEGGKLVNLEEMRKLGLAVPAKVEPVVSDPTPT